MALALSAGARRADSGLLRVCSSGVGAGFFVGTRMPIPAPWYPLSARTGIPNQADRCRAGSTWSPAAVGSWVEPGSTGPVYTGVHGNPAKIHHHLHVVPEGPSLARILQVTARVRVAPGDPVGADQGPVQARVRLFGPAQPLKDLGKVRGLVGDHPQGLMKAPVGRGPAHLRVPRQGGQGGSRHHPPQQEHRLNPARWPPSATASRHGPCDAPPTTGRWCGRWTREHPKRQDRTPAREPPGSGFNWSEHTIPGGPRAHHPRPPAQSLPHHHTDPRQSRALLVRKAQCRSPCCSTRSTPLRRRPASRAAAVGNRLRSPATSRNRWRARTPP